MQHDNIKTERGGTMAEDKNSKVTQKIQGEEREAIIQLLQKQE